MTIFLIEIDRERYTPEFKGEYSRYISELQRLNADFHNRLEKMVDVTSLQLLASAVSVIEPSLKRYFKCTVTGIKRKANAWNKERKGKHGGMFLYVKLKILNNYVCMYSS